MLGEHGSVGLLAVRIIAVGHHSVSFAEDDGLRPDCAAVTASLLMVGQATANGVGSPGA
jgi:hypothetical protein